MVGRYMQELLSGKAMKMAMAFYSCLELIQAVCMGTFSTLCE